LIVSARAALDAVGRRRRFARDSPCRTFDRWRLKIWSTDDWDAELLYFLDKGYLLVAHDRLGKHRKDRRILAW
jgi:hypothetical protein